MKLFFKKFKIRNKFAGAGKLLPAGYFIAIIFFSNHEIQKFCTKNYEIRNVFYEQLF